MYEAIFTSNLFIVICIISTFIYISILEKRKLDKNKSKVTFGIYLNFIVNLYLVYRLQWYFVFEHLLMGISILFILINSILLKKAGLFSEKIKTIFIIIIILIVQFGYVTYSPINARQHDSRNFIDYETGGHFGYIGYIYFNESLPTGDPSQIWCWGNPPLFHIISAIILRLQNLIRGLSLNNTFENLQTISCLYATVFMIYVYRILKQMKIKKSLPMLLAFVGLSPAIVIMSGSLNNDMLSIALSTMAIFYTLKWYEEDSLKNLIKIALSISLAMMTKISAALIAVPIAVVFLIKLIKNIKDIKRYICNFAIFAIIALPIGLWFPVKNLILYDIPLTYVQSPDVENVSNISSFTIAERWFGGITKENLSTINVILEGENIDYNLFLSTIKSFIVDEYIEYEHSSIMKISLYTMFICSIIISILFIVTIIYLIKNYKKLMEEHGHWLLFFAGIFILTIVSYIKFCFDYPFTFTMNFRYIVPTLISFAALTGVASDNNKVIKYTNTTVFTIFCMSSIIFFLNLL